MPKINVYLSDALATAVKEAEVPVSAVCQAALSDAVERVGRTRRAVAALRDPATPAALLEGIGDGTRQRMTPRLVTALGVAASDTDGQVRLAVSSLDLLRGLLGDGENLAVRLLLAQGVDVDALVEATQASETDEPGPAVPGSSDNFLGRLTMPGRLACAAALEAVVELGHNYVGCEHLLVGLAASEGRARDVLADHGAQAPALRQAIRAAAAGVVLERSRSIDRNAGALADLTRRLETLERQLAATSGA
jgi:ATP-dependent Clp protease ATP-binding subunit ClpA/post-segregation antitoxin (ccd killing protein)